MFVAMDKMSAPDNSNATSSHVRETVQPHPSQGDDAPFKLGDLVVFYDEKDIPVNGVVRWIGRNRQIMPNESKIVGIETVSCIFYITYLASYFK